MPRAVLRRSSFRYVVRMRSRSRSIASKSSGSPIGSSSGRSGDDPHDLGTLLLALVSGLQVFDRHDPPRGLLRPDDDGPPRTRTIRDLELRFHAPGVEPEVG